MMRTPPHIEERPGARRARQVAALLELGFENVPGPAATEARRVDGSWHTTEVLPAMGTRVAISVVDPSRDRADAALGGAWTRMQNLIPILSRHDEAGALAVLNDQGRLADPPPELQAVLAAAAALHRRSSGVFDPTVLPLIELLEGARGDAGFLPPDEAAMRSALGRVDGSAVQVGPREARFARSDLRVTLDGIAKGFIVDEVATALTAAGVESFLINAGGDIRTAGAKGVGRPWRVAVHDPGTEAAGEILSMGAGAVATSGSYEIWYDDDRTRHHLVRADDGGSPVECDSVTVTAPDAMSADALATTTFLLGPRHGLRFIESTIDCECMIVTRDGAKLRSRGWAAAPDSASSRRTNA